MVDVDCRFKSFSKNSSSSGELKFFTIRLSRKLSPKNWFSREKKQNTQRTLANEIAKLSTCSHTSQQVCAKNIPHHKLLRATSGGTKKKENQKKANTPNHLISILLWIQPQKKKRHSSREPLKIKRVDESSDDTQTFNFTLSKPTKWKSVLRNFIFVGSISELSWIPTHQNIADKTPIGDVNSWLLIMQIAVLQLDKSQLTPKIKISNHLKTFQRICQISHTIEMVRRQLWAERWWELKFNLNY